MASKVPDKVKPPLDPAIQAAAAARRELMLARRARLLGWTPFEPSTPEEWIEAEEELELEEEIAEPSYTLAIAAAAAGFMVGGPPGAAVGGLLGWLGSRP